MKKKHLFLWGILLAAVLCLTACDQEMEFDTTTDQPTQTCVHSFVDASCKAPKHCTLCGEREGEALGHDWQEATCETPRLCTRCGMTVSEVATHQPGEKTCTRCGKYICEFSPHQYEEGRCIYCDKLKPSSGLKFTLNADGQSYTLYSIGDCPDTHIVIPESYNELPVTGMTELFFYGSPVEKITIPKSMKDVGVGVLTNLVEIHVAEENEYYKSIDGVLYSKDGKTLVWYPQGRSGSFDLPADVTTIGPRAFYACRGLTEVVLPESIQRIEEEAFAACYYLQKLVILDSVMQICDGVFADCLALQEVTFTGTMEMWSVITNDCTWNRGSSIQFVKCIDGDLEV